MSKERDFHRLIENQNREKKDAMWKKLESRLEDEIDNVESCGEVLVLSKNRNLSYVKYIAISCFVALFLGLTVFLIVNFGFKKDDGFIGNVNRYCTVNDYYEIETLTTVKQYNIENGKNFLFFDFYEFTEYFNDTQFKLNETDEVICLYEEIVDEIGAFISFYITDDYTELDILEKFSTICVEQTSINRVTVNWGVKQETSFATFNYNGNNYYISVEYFEQDYILQLVELLLN